MFLPGIDKIRTTYGKVWTFRLWPKLLCLGIMRTMAYDEKGRGGQIEYLFGPGEQGRSYAREFLAEVRTNWRVADSALMRNVLLMLVMAAVFELINRNEVGGFSFAGVEVRNLSVVQIVIPVIVGFLYMETWELVALFQYYERIHFRVQSWMFPHLRRTSLARVLVPMPFGGKAPYWRLGNRSVTSRVAGVADLIRVIVLMLTPAVFLAYAFVQTFSHATMPVVFWLVSIIIVVVTVVPAAVESINVVGNWDIRDDLERIQETRKKDGR